MSLPDTCTLIVIGIGTIRATIHGLSPIIGRFSFRPTVEDHKEKEAQRKAGRLYDDALATARLQVGPGNGSHGADGQVADIPVPITRFLCRAEAGTLG